MTSAVNNAASAAAAAASTTNSSGSTSSNNSGVPSAADAQKSLNLNYQDFLSLLTTQLQNQDPTSPADVNQMTEEIAQLSTVQQQINTNNLLQQLVTMLGASQSGNAVSYIGKNVDATGNQIELADSQASIVYDLPAGTSNATVTITNAAGQTVFSGAGSTIAGRNQMLWNGVNSSTGATEPDGTYNFTVTATNSSGAAVTATTLTSGTVTAVDMQNGATTLSLGGISVPLANVQSVYTAGSNPG